MSYLLKLRYLRHPYLVFRAFFRSAEIKDSDKHKKRLKEYEKFIVPIKTDLVFHITGLQADYQVELENSDFLRHIEKCAQEKGGTGSVGIQSGQLFYSLVRTLAPTTIVETGVAKGMSSAFFLKALQQTGKGKLYSIDLHYREGVAVPFGKRLGWVISEDLKANWELVLGESLKVLPKLLKQLGCIDIFLHDSRHTYKTMLAEYKLVWPYLRKNGVLLSDDVTLNDAFLDFADLVNAKPVIFGHIGALRKTV